MSLNLKNSPLSERALAEKLGISRTTLRSWKDGSKKMNFSTLEKLTDAEGKKLLILTINPKISLSSDDSIPAVSTRVHEEGFETWKIHFFDYVDDLRRSKDSRLFLLPPISQLDLRLKAILASMTLSLAYELSMEAPEWAGQDYFLSEPWFPSQSESLKASALIESPLAFRKNNIFVLSNFLERR
ncbi:MAG: helix-turn-helix transcriptional regulator [Deltaproteobacteria bacterium]|nr:helix-turn-helix transcriptional regulator [Deltaproteobacteria bacterium]